MYGDFCNTFLDSTEEICLNSEKRLDKIEKPKKKKICKVIDVYGVHEIEDSIQKYLDKGYDVEYMCINEFENFNGRKRPIITLILNENTF